MEDDKQHKRTHLPTDFNIEGWSCDLLIEKGSYESMVSQEILTKQDLKVQQNLSCLNKGDEVEFQEVVIPFFVMKLPYNHVNTIGKPSWVEGAAHIVCTR